ncbi:ABC transporter permease [Maledivibacter halophilus]|uniref:ABC-2 type transport system permease protein n=1 Tax=Maledivibacter halophilus TaxID=36842 RepID=A0A1T5LKE5_9FIRM|nr:ABC transporter permease [Maledivibacter halophilus]SKC76354.1 ABC-2 type transport system permease protein [Maledivibacter halophilus]
MTKRLFALVKKDIVSGYRNYFFLVVMVVAVIFALIVNFAIPKDLDIKPSVYYNIEYEGENKEIFEKVMMKTASKHNNVYKMNSQDDIVENMEKNFNSIGIIIKEYRGKPTVELIMQGYENREVINSLILSLKDDIDNMVREDLKINTIFLNKEIDQEKVPFNKNVLPIFLTMEPTMLGLTIIAAFIFMEKDEGTIKAYKVSPGRISEYLASKIILMIILGLISTIISTFLVVGFEADYFNLILIVIVGSVFASGLGLIISSFFNNISESMIWIIFTSIVLLIPFASYFVPSFAPIYIRILPTYLLQFAIREAVFPSGNISLIYSTIGTFAVLSIINYIVAIFAYKRNLTRG